MKIIKITLLAFQLSTWTLQGQPGDVLSLNTVTLLEADSLAGQQGGFGNAVASIGDLNKDGIEDFMVGATAVGPSANRGAVYILFMDSDGTVKQSSKIAFGVGGFSGQLGFNGRFGSSLAYLGDIDKDGTVEVAVGNPFNNGQGSSEGVVWILSIDQNGTVIKNTEIGEGKSGFSGSIENEERFGGSLATMPDVDGDGIPELLVGAYNKDLGGTNTGRVYLIKLNANGTVKDYKTYDNNSTGIAGTLRGNFSFGESVGATEDLDGDGISEIIVGVPGDDIAFLNRGAIWILFLNSQLEVTNISKIHGKAAGFSTSQDSTSYIGRSLANAGDINGDGFDDLFIGSLIGTITSTEIDLIRIVFLDSIGGIKDSWPLSASSGAPFSGFSNPGVDFSGAALGILKDLNGDGKRDLLAGAPAANGGKGQIHILTLDGISHINTPEFEKEALDISLFPNPTTGKVQLELPEAFHRQELSLQFIDHAGKVVLRKKVKSMAGRSIELEVSLAAGSYLLQIKGAGQSVTRKLLITP